MIKVRYYDKDYMVKISQCEMMRNVLYSAIFYRILLFSLTERLAVRPKRPIGATFKQPVRHALK